MGKPDFLDGGGSKQQSPIDSINGSLYLHFEQAVGE